MTKNFNTMKTFTSAFIAFIVVSLLALQAQTPWLPGNAGPGDGIYRTGNIGIGINTLPQARVHIETPCEYLIQGDECLQSEQPDIRMRRSLQAYTGGPAEWRTWDIYNEGSRLGFFYSESQGTGTSKMKLDSEGRLNIAGSIWVDGDIARIAGGQVNLGVNPNRYLALGYSPYIGGEFTLAPGASGGAILHTDNEGAFHVSASDTQDPISLTNSIRMTVKPDGRVAIGTSETPLFVGGEAIEAYRLFVSGGILSQEVRVRTVWSDYVFDPDYKMLSLPEVANFIDSHGHLHDTPSGAQIEEDGLELGSMMANQQAKIEELYLHLIEMNQRVTALEEENDRLRQLSPRKVRK
jgi:hypothetical protein